jgi:hypothetical protein
VTGDGGIYEETPNNPGATPVLIFDMRAEGVTGAGQVLDAKHVTITNAGDRVTIGLYALVKVMNNQPDHTGMYYTYGGFRSSDGGLLADLDAFIEAPWDGMVSYDPDPKTGTFDSDADKDVGAPATATAGFWYANPYDPNLPPIESAQFTTLLPPEDHDGDTYKVWRIGYVEFTVLAQSLIPDLTTQVGYIPRTFIDTLKVHSCYGDYNGVPTPFGYKGVEVDLDRDGFVAAGDLPGVEIYYSPPGYVIPEPLTMAGLGFGILGLWGYVRRRSC